MTFSSLNTDPPTPTYLSRRRCDFCLLPWCETVETEHCPFCGCNGDGWLAEFADGEAA